MRRPLAKRIQENYPDMSKSQKKIAEYILQHYDKAVFLTAQKLGRTLDVSESTVIRFANLLGYDGFPQLQRALQDMVRNKITTVERLQLSLKDKEPDIARRVFTMDSDNMRRTLEELDTKAFAAAVEKILAARRIYIISLRSTMAPGHFLCFYLQLLLKNCRMINLNSFLEELAEAGPDDLVIGMSFARYTRQTVEGLQFARERGAATVCITDTLTSPLAALCDTVLLAHSETASFIDSFVAPLSLVNALIIAVGTRDPERTSRTLAEFEETWNNFRIYYDE